MSNSNNTGSDAENEMDVFWIKTYNQRTQKSEYQLDEPKLRIFLKNEGFSLFKGEPVQIIGSIAKKITPEILFSYSLRHVESFKDPLLEAAFLKRGEVVLLKNKAIILSLPECDIDPIKDTRNISYKYYQNGIVKVEPDKEIMLVSYDSVPGFVWDNLIIQRDFKIPEDTQLEKAIFARFVKNITNNEDHFTSICTAIGYLLHTYKDQRKPIAIIINDENLVDDGKPEGGTGKGLIIKALAQIVEKAFYNGKNSNFSADKFAYQNVKETTDILFIDDAPRNFDFESLFSVLTDDLPVEKKYQPVKIIPFEMSPKFVISTNYTINGDSSSYTRRRFDIFLNNFYHSCHTPADDFGDEFFHGWDEKEWQHFDQFMMACLRIFLTLGLIAYEDDGWRLKRLKNETSADFIELMEKEYQTKNILYNYISIRQKLVNIYGEKYNFLENNKKIIVEWVERYASHKEFNITKDRNGNGATFIFPEVV
jgi:hypothetical protein